ncbi:phage tail tip lysozyme [Burkholderia contaminans]|uniref:phage tail tip lysozyme n=1 Tax=Burkholderia TaxID=32008 RepID=UPI0010FA3A27|nr:MULTISPECIES: phage tail tip lysozyme [Burkholderia]MBD1412855.1 hypothetical protein [Burkholderia contaminans]UXZ68694.1 phage tail tip lysozyme [Burkholderia contaminans]UXZ76455.1 phage tail tip lysozyme [Burkholderia contaminans]
MANNFTITISAIDKATSVARNVNASISKITKPVADLGNEVKAFGKLSGLSTIGKGFGKLTSAAKSAASSVASIATPLAAITSFGTIAGVAALAASFGKTAMSVKNTAGVLGMPTAQLQAFQGAARLAGLASEDMTGGLKSLGATFEDSVTGRNLEAAGAMNQFGITVHRLKNGSVDTARALRDVSNVIQKMPNAQAQQRFANIFGVEQLLPLLQKGGDGIDKLADKAKSLGVVMSPEQVAAGEKYNEQMIQLEMSADKLKTSLGSALAPALERVIAAVERLVDKYGAVVSTKVAEYAERLANWLDKTDWSGTADRVSAFVDKIGGLKTIAIAIAAITFAGPIGGILTMTAGLLRLIAVVPLAVKALRALGKERAVSEAAKAATSAAESAGNAAKSAAGRGLLARLAPWLLKGGLAFTLMTHSEGLNTGEDAFLAQHRAAPDAQWDGDPIGQKIKAGAQKDKGVADAVAKFQSMGWTRAQAAGLAANLWRESLFDPRAVGDSGRAYGIGQWHEDRQAEFKKLFGIDIRKSSLDQQLQFVNYELRQGKESRAGTLLSQAKSAEQAGNIVSRFYERPGDVNGEASKRSQIASAIFNSPSSQSPSAPMAPIYAKTSPSPQSGSDSGAAESAPQSAATASQDSAESVASAAQSMAGPMRVHVEIDMRNAPAGTTARVKSAPGVTSSVRIGTASIGQDPV